MGAHTTHSRPLDSPMRCHARTTCQLPQQGGSQCHAPAVPDTAADAACAGEAARTARRGRCRAPAVAASPLGAALGSRLADGCWLPLGAPAAAASAVGPSPLSRSASMLLYFCVWPSRKSSCGARWGMRGRWRWAGARGRGRQRQRQRRRRHVHFRREHRRACPLDASLSGWAYPPTPTQQHRSSPVACQHSATHH